jgi:integrase
MDQVRLAIAGTNLTLFFQGRTVQDITKQTCRAYGVWRDKAPGTIRRDLTVLRAAINHAHHEGRLTRTVAVDLPEAPPPKNRWLTRDESARLLKAALQSSHTRLYLPLFIVIGLITGQRKEAILSLRWPQVDFNSGLIDFRVPGRKETKKKRSHIKIPPRLMAHLRNARKRGTDLGHVINENGFPIEDLKKGFAGAVKRAGLEGTGVTPHTLRHTCATWLMQANIPKWEVSGYLAMSMDTLERTYGHHHPDHYSAAGNSFSSRPRNVRATQTKNGPK